VYGDIILYRFEEIPVRLYLKGDSMEMDKFYEVEVKQLDEESGCFNIKVIIALCQVGDREAE
jgi:hypothetical protein